MGKLQNATDPWGQWWTGVGGGEDKRQVSLIEWLHEIDWTSLAVTSGS